MCWTVFGAEKTNGAFIFCIGRSSCSSCVCDCQNRGGFSQKEVWHLFTASLLTCGTRHVTDLMEPNDLHATIDEYARLTAGSGIASHGGCDGRHSLRTGGGVVCGPHAPREGACSSRLVAGVWHCWGACGTSSHGEGIFELSVTLGT
jgi:hypothetical protein